MTALVVPGVRVEARFDVLPPLPAPSGILGAVGIVDRPPADQRPVSVSRVIELRELLGPGTEHTMPEVTHALANGASEAVVAAVAGGAPARIALRNADSEETIRLRCRCNGAWGNDLRVEVQSVSNAAGEAVRINLVFTIGGRVVERFTGLVVAPGAPGDLVDTLNARSRLVVASDAGLADATPSTGSFTFPEGDEPVAVTEDEGARTLLELTPAPGVSRAGLRVEIAEGEGGAFDVRVFQGGLRERSDGLVMDPDHARYLPHVLNVESKWIRVRLTSSLDEDARLPAATTTPQAFTQGQSPTVQQYRDAIGRLADDPRIDLVLASIEPGRDDAEVRTIHQALLAHAVTMADEGAPRIAFGSVTADEASDLGRIRDHAAAVRHRQFVLVAPPGAAGAVAGMIGRLPPHISPTFKTVPLHGIPPARFRESELNRLLGPSTNLLVVQQRTGRGVVVLRGLDTTGDQISVTRVAHQAIRETRAIAEGFIGRLNTEEARSALRQQIIAVFTRMERENALVPSVDGEDPAFVVNVYSTQQDFAQGIVRIDIAVRPVRAIDFIYATIRVKN